MLNEDLKAPVKGQRTSVMDTIGIWRIYSSGFLVVMMIVVFLTGCSDGKAKQAPQRVVPVKVGDVTKQDLPLQINAIGNVEAYNTVSVKALVGGEVTEVHFREGQEVKQGDLLFQIDPRPYESALRQAEAQLTRD